MSEFQHASPEIETPPGEEWSIESDLESHRTYDEASSENYLASDEGPGEPGSSKSSSSWPSLSSSSDLPVELEHWGAAVGTFGWVESECQWFAGGGAQVRVSKELSR
jgi:hypothetical protein